MLIAELEKYISNIGLHYRVPSLDDYKQEVLLILFKKGNDFILDLHAKDKLKHYVYKICLLLIYSKNGDYYIKYIKPNLINMELKDVPMIENKTFKEEKLNQLVESLNGIDRTLLEQYIICRGNKNSLSKKSKINFR